MALMPWMEQRDKFVRGLTDAQVTALTAQISKDARSDENEGDRAETRSALEWLTSRGESGEEYGIVGRAAGRLGMFGADRG